MRGAPPSSIKVGPHMWEVIPDKALADATEVWGKTLIPSHQIRLDPNAPHSRLRETLLHELLHVVMHTTGLSFRLDGKECRTSEEEVVRETATCLYQVMVDNPGLVKFLMEGEPK